MEIVCFARQEEGRGKELACCQAQLRLREQALVKLKAPFSSEQVIQKSKIKQLTLLLNKSIKTV